MLCKKDQGLDNDDEDGGPSEDTPTETESEV